MAKITIDGKPYEVKDGITILQACLENGIDVPYYCWHPALSIAGNCRMCLVNVEKAPKPMIACHTQVRDGMVVDATSEKARKIRSSVMEFLLINHPLDCAICDQAGECKLQQFAYRHGQGHSRFEFEKVHKPKAVDFSDEVKFDAERCILCTRCVRFMEEVRGQKGALGILERGDRCEIAIPEGKPLDDPYSMNVVDICPVGALTSKDFRFRSRVWFMKHTDTVCASCSRGCNVVLGSRNDKVLRFVPRDNMAVNKWWMCDHGRLEYDYMNRADRLTRPLVRKRDGTQGEATWEQALDAAAEILREARRKGERIAALASPYLTTEELYLWRSLFRDALGARVSCGALEGPADGFLRTADASPNRAGARLVGIDEGATQAQVAAELESGSIDCLVVANHPTPLLDLAQLPPNLPGLICTDLSFSPLAHRADVVFPAASYAEKYGTFVNCDGRMQFVERAIGSPGKAKPEFDLLDGLLRRLAPEKAVADLWDVLPRMAQEIPALRGVDYDKIGPQGLALPIPQGSLPRAGPASAGAASR